MRLNSALELLEAAEHGFAHCVPFLKRVQNSLCCNLLLWIVIHIWTFFLLFLSVGFRSQKPQRPYHRQFSCPCFSLAAAFTTDECRVELISGQMVLSKVLIHSEDFPLQTRAEKPINVTRPHLLRSCKEDSWFFLALQIYRGYLHSATLVYWYLIVQLLSTIFTFRLPSL